MAGALSPRSAGMGVAQFDRVEVVGFASVIGQSDSDRVTTYARNLAQRTATRGISLVTRRKANHPRTSRIINPTISAISFKLHSAVIADPLRITVIALHSGVGVKISDFSALMEAPA